jgi:phytoene desaturase
MSYKATVIGSGFSSLSTACYLAKAGYQVTILEKNEHVGGRAQQLIKEGFIFDMGPTFYWMPDVFESFFNDFNKKVSDYFQLNKLNPAYEVYFGEGDSIKIGDNLEDIVETFENEEKGAAVGLKKFIKRAKSNYDIAIKDLVYKPGINPLEIINKKTAMKLDQFIRTIRDEVQQAVKSDKLRKILEFPVLFLGAKPSNTPAFYNFMNYADFGLGTWHPTGGMYELVKAMENLAVELGVEIKTKQEVKGFRFQGNRIVAVKTSAAEYQSDVIVSGADYHHTESILPKEMRAYSEKYWQKKTFAPSALLFYIAFDKKLKNISHHSLFFDTDFNDHAKEIYDTKRWPEAPLFYGSFPSITDPTVAPKGKEAGIFLIPVAPGLDDSKEIHEKYFNIIMNRMERLTGQDVRKHIRFKASYGVNDFKKQFHSYKGNAYGLANTLMQTHYLRPKLKSKKVSNLYFTGQLTVPGPGVPPSLISGKIVSSLVTKNHKIEHYEEVV